MPWRGFLNRSQRGTRQCERRRERKSKCERKGERLKYKRENKIFIFMFTIVNRQVMQFIFMFTTMNSQVGIT